jgi:hypothetical protein
MVIEKVMKTYRKNYSKAISLIIAQWLRFQKEAIELRSIAETESKRLEIEALSKAKVLKE